MELVSPNSVKLLDNEQSIDDGSLNKKNNQVHKIESLEKWIKILFLIISVLAGTCLGLSIKAYIQSNQNENDLTDIKNYLGISDGQIDFSRIKNVILTSQNFHAGTIDGSILEVNSIPINQLKGSFNNQIQASQISTISSTQISTLININQLSGVINNQIQSNQIQSIQSNQISTPISLQQISGVINGQIQSSQIASITSDKLSTQIQLQQLSGTIGGLIQSNQVNTILSTQIQNTISMNQIAGTVNNQIISSQIAGIHSTQILDQIQLTQIAGTVSGLIQSNQIMDISPSIINGLIPMSIIPFIPPTFQFIHARVNALSSSSGINVSANLRLDTILSNLGGSQWILTGNIAFAVGGGISGTGFCISSIDGSCSAVIPGAELFQSVNFNLQNYQCAIPEIIINQIQPMFFVPQLSTQSLINVVIEMTIKIERMN
jgi:hypothetical protein